MGAWVPPPPGWQDPRIPRHWRPVWWIRLLAWLGNPWIEGELHRGIYEQWGGESPTTTVNVPLPPPPPRFAGREVKVVESQAIKPGDFLTYDPELHAVVLKDDGEGKMIGRCNRVFNGVFNDNQVLVTRREYIDTERKR